MTVLYHYCSTSTFLSIISNQSIWLSSLNLSNDTMEGKLVATIIDRLAKHDGLEESYIQSLQGAVDFMERMNDGFGFCLSEEDDLLSQWRGYASDATGFSIGFSKEYLLSLSKKTEGQKRPKSSLLKVKYKIADQIELVKPTYNEAKKIVESGHLKLPRQRVNILMPVDEDKEFEEFGEAHFQLRMTILGLSKELYALKMAAFQEEKEWRLISTQYRDGYGVCTYRALNDRIVPYMELSLSELDMVRIEEVILGPKNVTPIHVVDNMLKTSGFDGVIIRQSEATYR